MKVRGMSKYLVSQGVGAVKKSCIRISKIAFLKLTKNLNFPGNNAPYFVIYLTELMQSPSNKHKKPSLSDKQLISILKILLLLLSLKIAIKTACVASGLVSRVFSAFRPRANTGVRTK